jgi:hypothetical protein
MGHAVESERDFAEGRLGSIFLFLMLIEEAAKGPNLEQRTTWIPK